MQGTFTSADQSVISNMQYIGTSAGLPQLDINLACVVWLAITSGDVALPWSQDQVENLLGTNNSLSGVRQLMALRPDFTGVALQRFIGLAV